MEGRGWFGGKKGKKWILEDVFGWMYRDLRTNLPSTANRRASVRYQFSIYLCLVPRVSSMFQDGYYSPCLLRGTKFRDSARIYSRFLGKFREKFENIDYLLQLSILNVFTDIRK